MNNKAECRSRGTEEDAIETGEGLPRRGHLTRHRKGEGVNCVKLWRAPQQETELWDRHEIAVYKWQELWLRLGLEVRGGVGEVTWSTRVRWL